MSKQSGFRTNHAVPSKVWVSNDLSEVVSLLGHESMTIFLLSPLCVREFVKTKLICINSLCSMKLADYRTRLLHALSVFSFFFFFFLFNLHINLWIYSVTNVSIWNADIDCQTTCLKLFRCNQSDVELQLLRRKTSKWGRWVCNEYASYITKLGSVFLLLLLLLCQWLLPKTWSHFTFQWINQFTKRWRAWVLYVVVFPHLPTFDGFGHVLFAYVWNTAERNAHKTIQTHTTAENDKYKQLIWVYAIFFFALQKVMHYFGTEIEELKKKKQNI